MTQLKTSDFHKGDFLIFASIAAAHGLVDLLTQCKLIDCERAPGLYERYPDIKVPEESRSDISRDGYLGLLYGLILNKRKMTMDRVIRSGLLRLGHVGRIGAFDYVNVFPVLPLFVAARYGSWVPTLPVLTSRRLKGTVGFRAHLMALTVMIELLIGKRRWSHRYTMRKLVADNPQNEWFFELARACGVNPTRTRLPFYTIPLTGEAATGWGSCPNVVMLELIKKAKQL